jgi:hypothetical protein
VTFEDDKKDTVLGTGIIKVNDHFTLNDAALVDKLGYNLLSVSQFIDADLDVLFCKSDSRVLDSSNNFFVAFLTLGRFFRLISHLYNLL